MEVLCALLFAINSVSSLGSGPYLPSGWKPSGPAFLLPSEVQTAPEPVQTTLEPKIPESIVAPSERAAFEGIPESAEQPAEPTISDVKILYSTVVPAESTTLEVGTTASAIASTEQVHDVFVQETEASGSDFLHEYGPPAVLDINQSVTVQGLPDIVTARSFKTIEVNQDEHVSLAKDAEVTGLDNKSDVFENEKVSDETEATTKSAEEDVSVQMDFTIVAKSGLEDKSIQDISEPTTTATSEETNAEESSTPSQSVTERTVKVDENVAISVKAINPEAQVTEDTSLEYQPPVSNEEFSQDNEVVSKGDTATLRVPLTPSEECEDVDVVKETEINLDAGNVAESSGLGPVSDVLSEQDRVGFREYGPPKSENERIENNETRRRRFSSRFASFNKH